VRREGGIWSHDLQSEGFFVETVIIFNFVQSLFLERSFDPVEHIVNVMLLWPRIKFEHASDIQNPFWLYGYGRDHGAFVIALVRV
jgi:hypothetical protein